MATTDDLGLFKPFTKRMAKATKQQIVDAFVKDGTHYSPSGFTARIVVEWCEKNNRAYRVSYVPRSAVSNAYYVVEL